MGVCRSFAIDACTQTTPLSGGTVYTTDGIGSESGDGNHELWHDGGGTMKMTVYGKNSAFKAEWDNAGDFLARVGLRWNETQPYSFYGNVVSDFAFTKSGTGGGYSFIGIYGWSNNPLVEYYIVENGFWTTPPSAKSSGGTTKGTLEIDGGTYDIFTYQRVQKPSIHGTATFMQFWSVRRTPRTCGHISISEHWKKWAELGMTLGKMYEAKLLVEAGGGKGTFDLSYGTVQANAPATGVSPEPRFLSGRSATWNTGKPGVLTLVGQDGKLLRSIRHEGSQPFEFPVGGLPGGVYLLGFQAAGEPLRTRKIVIE